MSHVYERASRPEDLHMYRLHVSYTQSTFPHYDLLEHRVQVKIFKALVRCP